MHIVDILSAIQPKIEVRECRVNSIKLYSKVVLINTELRLVVLVTFGTYHC